MKDIVGRRVPSSFFELQKPDATNYRSGMSSTASISDQRSDDGAGGGTGVDGLRGKIEKKASALGDELRKKTKEVRHEIRRRGKAAEVSMTEKRRQLITGSKTKRVRDYVEEKPVVKFTDKMVRGGCPPLSLSRALSPPPLLLSCTRPKDVARRSASPRSSAPGMHDRQAFGFGVFA